MVCRYPSRVVLFLAVQTKTPSIFRSEFLMIFERCMRILIFLQRNVKREDVANLNRNEIRISKIILSRFHFILFSSRTRTTRQAIFTNIFITIKYAIQKCTGANRGVKYAFVRYKRCTRIMYYYHMHIAVFIIIYYIYILRISSAKCFNLRKNNLKCIHFNCNMYI